MDFAPNKLVSTLALAAFLSVAVFAFAAMMPGGDGMMTGGCPFSAGGAVSLCPQDAAAMIEHHFSAYQSFTGALVPAASVLALLSVLFSAVFVVFALKFSPPLAPARARAVFDSPPADSYGKKIIRWLSLFENSPSL